MSKVTGVINNRNMIIKITTLIVITTRDSLFEKKDFINSHAYAIQIRINVCAPIGKNPITSNNNPKTNAKRIRLMSVKRQNQKQATTTASGGTIVPPNGEKKTSSTSPKQIVTVSKRIFFMHNKA